MTLIIAGYLATARSWRALVLVLVSVLGGQLLSTALKSLFERARPDLIPGAPQVFTASFPRGHSMLSAVTYLPVAALLARSSSHPVLQRFFVTVGIALTILVGVSRVALGVHWPADVLAGWCVGAAWALLCAWVASGLQARGKLADLSTASSARGRETPGQQGDRAKDPDEVREAESQEFLVDTGRWRDRAIWHLGSPRLPSGPLLDSTCN